jgi:predicted outer membrane repeat protein
MVNRAGDAGWGTGFEGDLRYAIEQADQATGNSSIVIAPTLNGDTITLSSPISIVKPSGTLTIQGPGADGLTISGGGRGEVFSVSPGSKVTIESLTITGGVGSRGGAIYNGGKLTLSNDTVTGNTALGSGGGVFNDVFGTLTLAQSTVSGNTAYFGGGGGISSAGTVTIGDSTVSGNLSFGANGGGISSAGRLTIVNSTISGNSASGSFGGGIYSTSALTLNDDTISGNTADISGGGIDTEAYVGGTSILNNTIVADNVATHDARTNDVIDNGDVGNNRLTGSNDLIGAGDLGTLTNTLVGVDPRLGPLQDNGGPTLTQALLVGSPALHAGDPALVAAGVNTDQRGPHYARIVRGSLDIGAFEDQSPRPAFPPPRGLLPPGAVTAELLIGLTIVPASDPHGTNP